MEFSCLKLDFQTLYRLQRQDFNISNTVNNEKRRKDIQEKGNKIFWTENANMKALIFVHLSSGSVSRKLGCRVFKYSRGNIIFGLLPLQLLHAEAYTSAIYFHKIFIHKSFSCWIFHVHILVAIMWKMPIKFTIPCNLTLLRSVYIVSFFLRQHRMPIF